jgi:hypothetical protein
MMAANRQSTAGRKRGKGKPFAPKDERINRCGAPKRGESWAEIIKTIGNLTPVEAADWAGSIARRLRPMGDKVTLREAAVLSAYAAVIFDPSASTLSFLADHAEGKLPTTHIKVSDWREEAKARGLDDNEVFEQFVEMIMISHAGTLGEQGSGKGTDG